MSTGECNAGTTLQYRHIPSSKGFGVGRGGGGRGEGKRCFQLFNAMKTRINCGGIDHLADSDLQCNLL